MYKQIFLKRGKEESLKRFHPWIFSGAIHHMDEDIEEGETVRVITAAGEFIAVGHYQIGSIAVRVLSFEDIEINTDFWCERLQSALDVRIGVGIADSPTNNTYRLVHGEGDYLPGLVIDCYGSTAVMQAHSVGMHVCRNEICQALVQVMGDRIANVYYKSETTLPYKADLHQENGFLVGGDASNVAMENGLKFHIDWLRGQKTGFFLDQKENRKALQRLVTKMKADKSRQAIPLRVLDCFTHMGTFALNAGFAGADDVTGLDISGFAVEQASANAKRNGLDQQVKFKAMDVFDALPRLQEEGEQYDIVVLDPPAFTKSREATKQAIKGYREINIRGLRLVKNGGYLCTCSCSHFMTQELFLKMIREAAKSAHKRLQQVEFRTQGPDHPILLNGDENSYYLKFFIFRCIEEK